MPDYSGALTLTLAVTEKNPATGSAAYETTNTASLELRRAGALTVEMPYSRYAADFTGTADEAMAWMTMTGVINGMGDGTLAPGEGATRAQIAAMFQRFCDWIKR